MAFDAEEPDEVKHLDAVREPPHLDVEARDASIGPRYGIAAAQIDNDVVVSAA